MSSELSLACTWRMPSELRTMPATTARSTKVVHLQQLSQAHGLEFVAFGEAVEHACGDKVWICKGGMGSGGVPADGFASFGSADGFASLRFADGL
eukprot:364952-Chlamydomonas_euryale.AAC.7